MTAQHLTLNAWLMSSLVSQIGSSFKGRDSIATNVFLSPLDWTEIHRRVCVSVLRITMLL